MPLSPALSKTTVFVSAKAIQVFTLISAFAVTANFVLCAASYCTNIGTTYLQFCNAGITF